MSRNGWTNECRVTQWMNEWVSCHSQDLASCNVITGSTPKGRVPSETLICQCTCRITLNVAILTIICQLLLLEPLICELLLACRILYWSTQGEWGASDPSGSRRRGQRLRRSLIIMMIHIHSIVIIIIIIIIIIITIISIIMFSVTMIAIIIKLYS